ncbi:MAG: carboxypeptidase-like regulatory domain-containing protein [Tannerellaceae bacterium]|nr:carboxypeptidase-like regulatory domain-containing protein [Tannerellaceae bacterium]
MKYRPKEKSSSLFLFKRLKIVTIAIVGISFVFSAPLPARGETASVNDLNQSAQTTKVNGVIIDAQGEAVIGASIQVKGTETMGTITDMDGRFTLDIPGNSVLVVSFIGYKTIEVPVNNQTTLRIILHENTELLDEIVVVGYGVQKKASVTGSVAAIQANDLITVKAPSVSNMLAGRLPGLRAVQRSGSPGDDAASVDIRGYGNMLVIVDGIERDYTQLNPNDIESISILKDAAAAVYGFKGSNGSVTGNH